MKIANTICIFFSFFLLSAFDSIDDYAPEKHISFESKGKSVDSFLSRTFSRLKKSYLEIGRNYRLSVDCAKSKSEKAVDRAVKKTVDHAKRSIQEHFE